MQPDLKREGLRWWRQAERDLDDARYAFAGERYNLACFLAQQSAEKALKAYLYSQGMEMVLGHSVRELSEMAAELDAEFATLGKEVAPLDQYYIPTRYPNGLPGGVPFEAFNEDDGQRGLRLAERVLDTVLVRLTPPETGVDEGRE
ncbi:MAG: HEPN domain-containing protein [Chloroflexota bacterium]|nr:HEPN domain-containing protein [Chloroflexota bacterium]